MEAFKVVFNFVKIGEARFGTKANSIVTKLTTEPMLTLVPDQFVAQFLQRVALKGALVDYKAAQVAAADGSKSAIKVRIQKRAILEGILKNWATVLELAAKKAGDITILTKSGYDLRRPIVRSVTNGVPPPPFITVKRGAVSGSAVVRVKPLLRHVSTYQGEYAVGDPTVEANFKPGVISVTGSRITFTELEVAKLHQIRVRGIGRHGPGDWSNPASIIVT